MLDRNKLSDRSAMMVVTETARTLGHSIEGLALNRSTIRRQRRTHREAKASAIMDDFKLTTPVIVHWDGKIMQDLKVKEQVDRLPVLVSSMGTSKLLGAPKIGAGTGQAQAQAVVSLLKKWNLEDTVRGLCFDTTASNTGRSNGACMLIEQALGLDLLYFACRHHVHELVLAAAFKAALGGTSGPDVLLFKRFQTQWVFIDREKWEDGLSHEETAGILAGRSDELAEFFTGHLSEHQPRDDYKELLDLCLLFLGAHPSPPSFRAPGTVHHARWMAKAIYCIKIWMFRGQFQLTAKEERGLRDLALFVVTMYAKPWFLAPNVLRAAHTDLDLLKALLNYPQHAIGKATTKKLAGHAWYLSEDLVGLAIFDETLPDGEREALRDALAKEGEEHPPKRPSIDLDGLPNKRLADFASQKSKEALTMLSLHVDVLRDPVGTWSSRDDYQAARTMAATLACTNDHAERVVALVQEFSRKLTAEEEQVQWALQVVEENRAKYPDAKKATLLN